MTKSPLNSALTRSRKPPPPKIWDPGRYGYNWGMSGWDWGQGPYQGTVFGKSKKGLRNWDPSRNVTSRRA